MEKIINTEYGAVTGFKNDGCDVYLGIPFASPPVGKLTFTHPVKPRPWPGVLKATSGSHNPVQASGGFVVGNNSLDCLYLNVFAPENAESLPVMFWIYGGAYSQGGAGALEENTRKLKYDMARFARETRTVVITANYRLNLYGFLNLHSMVARFDSNNGLFDQILALEFVRDNIAAFGGDPENVTVFGQSAGAACILALMTMPEAEGLFSKAIVQSACIDHFFTEEESLRYARKYLKYLGVSKASELFNIPPERVGVANNRLLLHVLKNKDIRCPFSPVIDGVTLRRAPKTALRHSKIPLLIGHTSHEGNLFLGRVPKAIVPLLGKYMNFTPEKSNASYRQRACDQITDLVYVRPMLEILQSYGGPAWRYEFSYTSPGSRLGCCHASDMPVLFGYEKNLEGISDPGMERPGTAMRKIWSRFAWKGDPGWGRFSEGGIHVIR